MINPLFRSSPTRIMGMASGMDTDFIIQQTLRLHQMKIDSRMRARTILEWRQATQTSVRDQIQAFRNTFLTTGGLSGMLNKNTYNGTVAEVSGKNAGAVSVRTLNGATPGTFRIDQIVSLARGANMTSANRASISGQGFAMSARIDSLSLANGPITFNNYKATAGEYTISRSDVQNIAPGAWGNAETTFNVGDHKVTLTKNGGNVDYSIVDGDGIAVGTGGTLTFDSSGVATLSVNGENIEITEDGGAYKIEGTTLQFHQKANVAALDASNNPVTVQVTRLEGATDPLAVSYNGTRLSFAGEAQINIDGVGVTLKSDMTITAMLAEVNSKLAEAGKDIKMNYDSRADRFSFESATVGGASFTASGQALLAFGFTETASGSGTFASVAGSMAEMRVTINGITDTIFSDSNTFTLGDAVITVNNTTQAGDDPITVALKRDTNEAMNKIRTFIDAYNAIIKRIEGLVRERKSANEVSYGPLTNEEKATMSDKQIEEWESIARKGILRNDSGLQNLANNLRRELYAAVGSAGLSPQEIGLTTGRFDAGTGGQILIDEDRLRAALESDPDKVAEIFAGTEGNSGLLWRINDHMSAFTSRVQPRTLKGLEDSIKRANEQMTKMQERMFAEEDKLYRQFAAMETALSKIQQQGDWFSAMLGGIQK